MCSRLLRVAKYTYVLGVSKGLSGPELDDLKVELCRIFATEEVTFEAPRHFELVSGLNPAEVGEGLRRLTGTYGPVELRAGSKLE